MRISILLLLFTAALGTSCNPDSNTISSKDLSREERIATLKANINSYSDIIDAEYDLFKTGGFNNHGTVALGPTDYDYRYAVKVKPEDVKKWIEGLSVIEGDANNEKWMGKLLYHNSKDWKTNSKPILYGRKDLEGTLSVVYMPEGIIYRHIELN